MRVRRWGVVAPPRVDRVFWNLHARTWDDDLSQAERAERVERIVAHVGADARAVDLGCGTGSYLAALAAHGVGVVGVDFAPAMLARARRQAPAARLVEADLNDPLPFDDGDFDAALCVYAFQCVRDAPSFLGEVARILRPGGVFLAAVVAPGARPIRPRRLRPGAWTFWLAKQAIARTDSVRRYTPQHARSLLEHAGFTVLDERGARGATELLARYDPKTAR
jgi:ubiquinone/menaquinone biosynthesis C-methylase UbiE